MNQTDLVIRGRRVVTENAIGPASAHISQGRIVGIAGFEEIPAGGAIVEAGEDSIVMPGLVDTHVHVNEPGRARWEGFETATKQRRQVALRQSLTCRSTRSRPRRLLMLLSQNWKRRAASFTSTLASGVAWCQAIRTNLPT